MTAPCFKISIISSKLFRCRLSSLVTECSLGRPNHFPKKSWVIHQALHEHLHDLALFFLFFSTFHTRLVIPTFKVLGEWLGNLAMEIHY
jgi:hypothetical protein